MSEMTLSAPAVPDSATSESAVSSSETPVPAVIPETAGQPPVWTTQIPPYKKDRFSRALEFAVTRPAWLAPMASAGMIAAACIYVNITNPTDGIADPQGGCVFRLLTGFDCPGCGGTRAFWYAMHGNLPAAARHHAPFIFALPFMAYIYVQWAAGRFGLKLPALRIHPMAVPLFLGFIGVWMVLRNLPWAPFTFWYV